MNTIKFISMDIHKQIDFRMIQRLQSNVSGEKILEFLSRRQLFSWRRKIPGRKSLQLNSTQTKAEASWARTDWGSLIIRNENGPSYSNEARLNTGSNQQRKILFCNYNSSKVGCINFSEIRAKRALRGK